jgi:hypothetical protein
MWRYDKRLTCANCDSRYRSTCGKDGHDIDNIYHLDPDCPLPELTVIEGCEGCPILNWSFDEFGDHPPCAMEPTCPFEGMTVKFPEGK